MKGKAVLLLKTSPSSSDGYAEGTADDEADGAADSCGLGCVLLATLSRSGSVIELWTFVRLPIDVMWNGRGRRTVRGGTNIGS